MRRLDDMAGLLEGLWASMGQRFMREMEVEKELSPLPAQLRVLNFFLKEVLTGFDERRPRFYRKVKTQLVQRARELTGQWRDAELATLVGEDLYNWKSWRKKWVRTKGDRRPGESLESPTGLPPMPR
jgi:hypothetical protein